jgi:hypothetical protein
MITIKRGDSFTVSVELPAEYDVSGLTGLLIAIETLNPINLIAGATANPRIFRGELSSALTNTLTGRYRLNLTLIDAVFGARMVHAETITSELTLGNASNETNDGIDYAITVEMVANTFTATASLLNLTRGYSAFDVAVQNGFDGNENDWLTSLIAGGGSAAIVIIQIDEKGNDDVITHSANSTLLVINFFDDNDGGRHKDVFYATAQTLSTFELKNDFDNDKYTGKLLCVKY